MFMPYILVIFLKITLRIPYSFALVFPEIISYTQCRPCLTVANPTRKGVVDKCLLDSWIYHINQ